MLNRSKIRIGALKLSLLPKSDANWILKSLPTGLAEQVREQLDQVWASGLQVNDNLIKSLRDCSHENSEEAAITNCTNILLQLSILERKVIWASYDHSTQEQIKESLSTSLLQEIAEVEMSTQPKLTQRSLQVVRSFREKLEVSVE